MELFQETDGPVFLAPEAEPGAAVRPGFLLIDHPRDRRTRCGEVELAGDDTHPLLEGRIVDPDGRAVECHFNGEMAGEIYQATLSFRMVSGYINDASFCLALEVPFGPEDELCLPGLVYGGHEAAGAGAGPCLNAASDWSLAVAGSDLAMPGAGVYWPRFGAALWLLSPNTETRCGPTGVGFRWDRSRARAWLEFGLPLLSPRCCRGGDSAAGETAPMYLGEGGALSGFCGLRLGGCADRAAFYESFILLRQTLLAPAAPLPPSLPWATAGQHAIEALNAFHWQGQYYVQTVTVSQAEHGPLPDDEAFPGECHFEHGRGGAPLAYALSRHPDPTARQRAHTMLDFIAEAGLAPSGLFYSAHSRWSGLGDPPYAHIRPALDACYYLLQACRVHGMRHHPRWRTAVNRCLDALVSLVADAGQLGQSAARNGETALWETGSAAGGLGLAALALGHRLCGREDCLAAAKRAAGLYAACLQDSRLAGADRERPEVVDALTPLLLIEGFTTLSEETRAAEHRQAALTAAARFATWIMASPAAFPPASELGRRKVSARGAVIPRVDAPTLLPAPAGSLGCLLRLYRTTGEEWLLQLLAEIARALPQFVSLYHADLGDLRRGMAASNLVFAQGAAGLGSVAPVSHTGTAQALLLLLADVPGVYVDPPRSVAMAFDHLELDVDFETRVFTITNPTAYPAAGTLVVEVGTEAAYELAPGEGQDFVF